jgi:hypothetical protein
MHVMQAVQVSCTSFNCISLMNLTVFHRQGLGCPKQEKVLISEHTMLRHHTAAIHLVCIYLTFFEVLLTLVS